MFVLGASLLPHGASSDRTILQSVRGSPGRGVAQEEAPERGRGSPERPEGRLAAGGRQAEGTCRTSSPLEASSFACIRSSQHVPGYVRGPGCCMRGISGGSEALSGWSQECAHVDKRKFSCIGTRRSTHNTKETPHTRNGWSSRVLYGCVARPGRGCVCV